jgi:hypothetical protein
MADEGPEPLRRRLRNGLRTYRYPVSLVVLIVGIVLIFLAIGDFIPQLASSPLYSFLNKYTDPSQMGSVAGQPNYDLAFVIIGPIIALIGGYLVGAYVVARRKFEHLMESRSKAEFLRNIPELEEILWDLTPADEQRYLLKRAELKIRR